MTEPIAKKSGYQNRRSKARKLEELKIVLDKTKTIQSFFPSQKTTVDASDNQPHQESPMSNDDPINIPSEKEFDSSEILALNGNCISY